MYSLKFCETLDSVLKITYTKFEKNLVEIQLWYNNKRSPLFVIVEVDSNWNDFQHYNCYLHYKEYLLGKYHNLYINLHTLITNSM